MWPTWNKSIRLHLQQSYILSDAVVVAGVEISPFVPLLSTNETNKGKLPNGLRYMKSLLYQQSWPNFLEQFSFSSFSSFVIIPSRFFCNLHPPPPPTIQCCLGEMKWKQRAGLKWTSLYPTLIKSAKGVLYVYWDKKKKNLNGCRLVKLLLQYDKVVYMRVTVIRWLNMFRQLLRKMTANVFNIMEVVSNLSWVISAQQEKRLDWFSWEPNTIIDDRGVPKPTLVHEEIRHVLRHENSLFGMVDSFTCCPLKGIFLRMPLSSVKGVIISWWKKKC